MPHPQSPWRHGEPGPMFWFACVSPAVILLDRALALGQGPVCTLNFRGVWRQSTSFPSCAGGCA